MTSGVGKRATTVVGLAALIFVGGCVEATSHELADPFPDAGALDAGGGAGGAVAAMGGSSGSGGALGPGGSAGGAITGVGGAPGSGGASGTGGAGPCVPNYTWPRRADGTGLTAAELAQAPPACGPDPGHDPVCSVLVAGVSRIMTKTLPSVGTVVCAECSYWPRPPAAPECLIAGGDTPTPCSDECGHTWCFAGIKELCVASCSECGVGQ